MPILRTNKVQKDLHEYAEDGSKFTILHAEKIDDILKQNYEDRKDKTTGWNQTRTWKRIARIPHMAFLSRPQLANPDGTVNEEELRKFLNSPEGELFKTTDEPI